ncbi:Thiol-disulfide isomerase or thioredoxin [Chryseobacterium taichungense]|uniref:Thiol-disulfide isomerase or thioredoxin n=1 Tax=Chryseobacterium taichungense TaxID=295069 RepID=A0A1H7YH35_9FLAO|nr:TlpA disulfide reductase family protein [Chryseobacterium taichungense]SEM45420.1 Thiol-disulfide isomerase or thioredoxin [Chryseobacterium taichungense]
MQNILKSKIPVLILPLFLFSSEINAMQSVPQHKIQIQNPNLFDENDDIVLVDENGKKISLSELKGKVVFINFWATWCRPCVEEMPTLNRLKNKFKGNDDIIFVFLNVEANLTKAMKFMKDKNYDLPVYVAGDNIPSKYFQGAIPTTLIFNKKGELEAQIQGGRDFDQPQIYEALKKLTEQ